MIAVRISLGSALAALVMLAAGCATTDEGELPWATPEPWEGAPTVPGLNQY